MPQRKTHLEASLIVRNRGFEPLEEYPGAHKPWRLQCLKCKGVVTPTFSNITHNNNGCKYCAGRAISENDAISFMLSKGVKPLQPYAGNKEPWKCECLTCGQIIYPKYNNAQTQHPCKFCSLKSTSGKKISKAATRAKEIMYSKQLEPLEDYPGSHNKWKCRCLRCNQIVFPKFNTVHQGGGGCIYCAPNYLDPELAEKNMIQLGYQPLEEYESTKTKWKCVHIPCGRQVSVRYNTISSNQGGCRYCARHGFNFNEPAYFYLMTNPDLRSHKIGIGTSINTRKDRIKTHQKHGWQLVERLDFEIGEKAYLLEKQLLEWIRVEKDLPHYLTKEQMPQRGETETIGSDSITLNEIWKKVLELIS
jgi:hypothetical protein